MSDNIDGDEWKHAAEDDPNDPVVETYVTLFGTTVPVRRSQKEARARAEAELKAKRAAATMMRPPYRPAQPCTKCGHTKARTTYSKGDEYGTPPEAGTGEHLVRTCKRCRYQWYESVLPEPGE